MNAVAEALFRHNLWANLRLIDFCAHLDSAQLDAVAPGTRGTIRDTLLHIVDAEEWYVDLLSDQKCPLSVDAPDVPVLRTMAQWTGDALMRLASEIAGDLVRHDVQAWGPTTFQAVVVLIQALNHGTEHRSQIKTILSQQGIDPPHLDGWVYGEVNDLLGGWHVPYND